MPVASILLGIVALLFMMGGFLMTGVPVAGAVLSFGAPLSALVGIVLAGIAMSRAKRDGQESGAAVAGLVVNIIAFILGLAVALTCGLCNVCFSASAMGAGASAANNPFWQGQPGQSQFGQGQPGQGQFGQGQFGQGQPGQGQFGQGQPVQGQPGQGQFGQGQPQGPLGQAGPNDPFESLGQQMAADLSRLSLTMTLAGIGMSCAGDPSGAQAAQAALHPAVVSRYQRMLCGIPQTTLDAFAQSCDEGTPCSTASVLAVTPDAAEATALGLDATQCYVYQSGSGRIIGCNTDQGYRIILLENVGSVP